MNEEEKDKILIQKALLYLLLGKRIEGDDSGEKKQRES